MRGRYWLLLVVLGAGLAAAEEPPPAAGYHAAALGREEGGLHWLTRADSRLVLNPSFALTKPEFRTPPPAGGEGLMAPVSLACYEPTHVTRLPWLWAWQRGEAEPTLVPGPVAVLSQAASRQWTLSGTQARFDGSSVELTCTRPGFGVSQIPVKVDLDRTPYLALHVLPRAGTKWTVVVNDGVDPHDIPCEPSSLRSGSAAYDIAKLTGWHGVRSFLVRLYVHEPGSRLALRDLRFYGLRAAPAGLPARRQTWYPHQLVDTVTAPGFRLEAHATFIDAMTIGQRVEVSGSGGKLRLIGSSDALRPRWNAAQRLLELGDRQTGGVVMAFSHGGRLRQFGSLAALLLDDEAAEGPVWSLELDGLASAQSLAVAARVLGAGEDWTARGADLLGWVTPERLTEAIAAGERQWTEQLARVPRPHDFKMAAIKDWGVSPRVAETTYYAAWAFVLANVIPPLPGADYRYPQVPCGKPSLWSLGDPRAPYAAQWESADGIQLLGLLDPATAWAALEGMATLVGSNGEMGGERLPTSHCQAAWVLYQLTGDEARLRRLFPALERRLLNVAADPRWQLDAQTAGSKDILFVDHALIDMGYAQRIAQALHLPDRAEGWRAQAKALYASYRQWFWETPGGEVYHYHKARGERTSKGEPEAVAGLAMPADLLEPPERDSLLRLFQQSYHPNEASFGLTRVSRFGTSSYAVRGAWRHGLPDHARNLADAALRSVAVTGAFAESYDDAYPARSEGVQPSLGGALAVIDAALFRHGVILGDGLPILAHTPSAEGVENLPLLGSTLSVRFALHGTDVDVSGGALAQLEVPPGFVATPQAAGSVAWHGRLDVGQQVALQRAHAH